MDTSKLSNDEPAVRISKSLCSKGDMDSDQEPLATFSHWLWGHIPIPRDVFLQKNIKKYIYYSYVKNKCTGTVFFTVSVFHQN